MKVSSIAPVAALAATASAWDWGFFGRNNNNSPGRPQPGAGGRGANHWFPSFPQGLLFGPLGDPSIPKGQTKTATATTLSGAKSIIPVVPTTTGVAPSNSVTTITTVVPTSTIVPIGNNSTGVKYQNTTTTIVQNTTNAISAAQQNPNNQNDATHRGNWLPGFDITTDPTLKFPNTGNTVKYTFNVGTATLSPQGDKKDMLVINGQYPGPLIRANWGDMIEVTVINNLKVNGTSIHWHGFQQKGTNDQDGVGGITECPLAPGSSRVYRFQATSHGTSWYHSHFSSQYGDGVAGPIIIDGPASANYDIDLGVVNIADYFPLTAFQEEYLTTRFGPPTASNYLINGQNAKVDGSGGQRAKFQFTPGKKHRMRVVNTGVDNQFKLQIDGHTMTVIMADFVAIKPYQTKELSLSAGQRYDIIVEANQKVDNYWLRALAAADCSFNQNSGKGTANAIVSYTGASNSLPSSSLTTTHSDACVDESNNALVPVATKSVDKAGFQAQVSTLPVTGNVLTTNNDRLFKWNLGGISQKIDWADPTLQDAVSKNTNFAAQKNVVTLNSKNQWTYWVIQNRFFVPHPMHLHGHDFSILGSGAGTFSASNDISKLNFANPPRRDTTTLIAQGWTVIAFQTDNPGAWLMHCHIAWHVSGGLSMQFLERPSDIPGIYSGKVSQQQCSNWKKYAATMVYPQSDSGLKRDLLDGLDGAVGGADAFERMVERDVLEGEQAVSEYALPRRRGAGHDFVQARRGMWRL